MYWVTTTAGNRLGPIDDWAFAFWSGLENFGFEGWEISSKKVDNDL